MKILVINGSPKGRHSITFRHIQYFMKENPEQDFGILQVANRIGKIESDEALFNEILDKMAGADAIIWSFPSITPSFRHS